MTFSNPAGNAAASAKPYVRALLDVLGDREPLDVLPELVPWLERRLSGVPEAALRRPEAPGKWSVVEVVQHLADSELVFGFREPDDPVRGPAGAPGLRPGPLGARLFRYREVPLDERPGAARARSATANLARPAPAAARRSCERVGMHSERGPESLGHLMQADGGARPGAPAADRAGAGVAVGVT